MSLKHAILGFLSFKSLTGYDLKKAFDQSVRHFWPANQSQIYRTLAVLNDEGLVSAEVIEREERLDMKIYHITDAGKDELHQWLSTPLPAPDSREPLLIQIYFGGRLSDEEIIRLLEHEIRGIEERLAVYRSIYQKYRGMIETQPDPRAYFLSVATLEYGLLSNQVAADWLKSVVARLTSGTYVLHDF